MINTSVKNAQPTGENTQNLYRNRRLHAAVWACILLFYLAFFIRYIGVGAALLRGLVNTGLMASLFYTYWWSLRQWKQPERSISYWLFSFFIIGVVTIARTYYNQQSSGTTELPFIDPYGRPWFWACLVTNLGIVALSYLFYLNEKRLDAEYRNLQSSEARRKAELSQLRSQINPHFLFNVLNNIYALATVQSPKTAPTILQLSGLMRYVTYQGTIKQIDLLAEVEQLERYIDLFQLRGNKPFDITFSKQGLYAGIKIEPLLLLPLVENAFKHGNFVIEEKAYARFSLVKTAHKICFTGENSFDPNESQKDEQSGVGLENILRRLELTYGPAGKLEIQTDQVKGVFTFNLEIPCP